jgi:Tfp pilus assembly protein PilX
MRRLWRRCSDERGIALVIALSIMALLLVGGVFLLRMSSIEGDIAYNTVWAEGSFFAADAAINVAVDTIAPNVQNCSGAQTAIGGGFAYQVQNTPPATNCFAGTQQEAGYSLGSGTGYNPSGYVFYTFAFTGSGTGPRSAQRTIDAQATYGPIAQ